MVKDHLIGCGLSIVALAYYLPRLCPTYYFWDSAELSAAVASAGIPHPPGFPIFLILGRFVDWLVPGNTGGNLALFSALCAAAATWLFYFVLIQVGERLGIASYWRRGTAAVLAVALIISQSLAAQAIKAEVYALNLLVFIAMLLLLISLCFPAKSGDVTQKRKLILACYLLGLGLANHSLTFGLVIPGIVYLLTKRKSDWRTIVAATMATLVPISLYLYLLFIARLEPEMNWGNPRTLSSLVHVILAKGFDKSAGLANWSHIADNVVFGVLVIYKQLGPLLFAFSLVGIVACWRRYRRMFWFLAVILTCNLFSCLFSREYYYENLDLHGYLLFSVFTMVILAAVGSWHLFILIPRLAGRLLMASAVALGVALAIAANWGKADLSGNYAARRYAGQILSGCQKNSVVITSFYNTYFCLRAFQLVDRQRNDVMVVNAYLFGQRWYQKQLTRRLNLERSSLVPLPPAEFYRLLINSVKDTSEIYVEYDEFSAPLRKYLWPEGFLLSFKRQPFEATTWESAGNAEIDQRRFADWCQLGLDYEELKSILWFLRNRVLFFDNLGAGGLARQYEELLEHLAKSGLGQLG